MTVNGKSDAYREGYTSYQSWSWHSGDRPDNPYWTGDIQGESVQFEAWQQGWDDASFDD